MDKDILNTVIAELTVAYMAAGRSCSEDNLNVVAQSLTASIPFATAEEVHEAFRRSKEVQDIPTQRTLSEALRNHRAEAPAPSTAPQLTYRNPLETWLPSDPIRKAINTRLAISNYCAAVGDKLYSEYCHVSTHVKDHAGRWTYSAPEKVEAFEATIKQAIRKLYPKYWRKCVCSTGYPEGAPIDLALSPPTVPEFRAMLAHEAHA